jgi:hypothetical protein
VSLRSPAVLCPEHGKGQAGYPRASMKSDHICVVVGLGFSVLDVGLRLVRKRFQIHFEVMRYSHYALNVVEECLRVPMVA